MTDSDIRRRGTLLYPHLLSLTTVLLVEPALKAPYLSVAHWLREFYTWPPVRRRAWQESRLQHILYKAIRDVAFYRHRFALPLEQERVQLLDFPVVSKECIRSEQEHFLADGSRQMRKVTKTTGGTSGDPWRYPLDRRAWVHTYAAQIYFWEQLGYRYGEPVAWLGTPPSLGFSKNSLAGMLRRRMERSIVSGAGLDIDHRASLRRAEEASAVRASLWYGYAGVIAAMADAILVEDIAVTPPLAVVTTSETLLPAWRRNIEHAFGAPVVDEYGCNDGGILSYSCPAGRHHLAENISLVEILEGDEPCAPGEEGDIVVTNLHARLMPFIRYRIGDRGVLSQDPCPCKRPGTTLERLAGRIWDRIHLPNGTVLAAPAFNWIFLQAPNVRRWQVAQTSPNELTVRVAVRPGFSGGERLIVQQGFHQQCGGEVRVKVTTSEPMERSQGGKHRPVVQMAGF